VGEGELSSRQAETAGVPAGAQDELLRLQAPSIPQDQRILAGEAGRACPIEDVYPGALQALYEALFLVYLLDEAARPFEHLREIHLGRFTNEAVAGELVRVSHEARGVGEDAGRDAAVVGAGAAQPFALHEGHPCPELPGA
jgi:hypothetical protein